MGSFREREKYGRIGDAHSVSLFGKPQETPCKILARC